MGAERAGEASRRTYHLLVSIWSLPCSADRRACTSTNGGPEKQMSHEGGVKGYHCPRQEMVQAGLGSFGKALALPASGLEFDPKLQVRWCSLVVDYVPEFSQVALRLQLHVCVWVRVHMNIYIHIHIKKHKTITTTKN